MNSKVWEASGHLANFTDSLLDCKDCKARHRADNLINSFDESAEPDSMTQEEMLSYINENKVPCPKCGASNFTDIRRFNLMLNTQLGAAEGSTSTVYLRPENAQGEYVNFLNVLRSMRVRLPFGIGQIGKGFRNEITPGKFIFRTVEFEQMEYQTFCKEGEDEKLYDYFKRHGIDFFKFLGIGESNLRFCNHIKLAHYAKAACDIEYLFPFGWGEINGTHNRTDYDLRRHQEYSGVNQSYFDEKTNERFIPFVVESTCGVGRTLLAVLFDALEEEKLENGDSRLVLRLKPFLAPYKVSVLPLHKKHHSEKASQVCAVLKKHFMTSYDDAGSIGKRYRRGDAIGTPYALTVDNNTLENNTVTLRERDSMKQIELNVNKAAAYISREISFSV
jgi:glycyl-tRNA synthetase